MSEKLSVFRCARNAGSTTNKSSKILCFPDVGCIAQSETGKLASAPRGEGIQNSTLPSQATRDSLSKAFSVWEYQIWYKPFAKWGWS